MSSFLVSATTFSPPLSGLPPVIDTIASTAREFQLRTIPTRNDERNDLQLPRGRREIRHQLRDGAEDIARRRFLNPPPQQFPTAEGSIHYAPPMRFANSGKRILPSMGRTV